MGFVFSLLKANGVERSSKLVKLPKIQRVRTKAYNSDDLAQLFAVMTPEEYLQYLFFLRTGCREQEVQFATWGDIDLKNLRFTITGEGKQDVGFVPNNHEERWVLLTTELGALLAEHKRRANRNAGFSRTRTVSRKVIFCESWSLVRSVREENRG